MNRECEGTLLQEFTQQARSPPPARHMREVLVRKLSSSQKVVAVSCSGLASQAPDISSVCFEFNSFRFRGSQAQKVELIFSCQFRTHHYHQRMEDPSPLIYFNFASPSSLPHFHPNYIYSLQKFESSL